MLDYKYDWEEELERRRRLGITDLPAPILHPDDVRIDGRTGDVKITGPMSADEVPKWEMARQHGANFGEFWEHLDQRVRDEPDNENLSQVLDHVRAKYNDYVDKIGPPRKK